MKYIIFALTALISSTAANFTISEPWSQTVWNNGQTGTVSWSSTPDVSNKSCEIHLLTGSSEDATFVANFSSGGNLVPCHYTKVNLHPLPDYPSGDYFVRVGVSGDLDSFSYSSFFKFIGNGTVEPVKADAL
ncbi:hypothetical protein K501DRAFT_191323 [Backusella circina FSU 941]|nr:hypothetical protein K501DRAFT_191323 [Backusella circina FSU 941]